MSTPLILVSTGAQTLSQPHLTYLGAAIQRYRDKAARALRLAQQAARHGNRYLAAGLINEAETFRAMAQRLTDQSNASAGDQS
jgi:hypothetical protein